MTDAGTAWAEFEPAPTAAEIRAALLANRKNRKTLALFALILVLSGLFIVSDGPQLPWFLIGAGALSVFPNFVIFTPRRRAGTSRGLRYRFTTVGWEQHLHGIVSTIPWSSMSAVRPTGPVLLVDLLGIPDPQLIPRRCFTPEQEARLLDAIAAARHADRTVT